MLSERQDKLMMQTVMGTTSMDRRPAFPFSLKPLLALVYRAVNKLW